jgi:hypothetical protein
MPKYPAIRPWRRVGQQPVALDADAGVDEFSTKYGHQCPLFSWRLPDAQRIMVAALAMLRSFSRHHPPGAASLVNWRLLSSKG